MLSIEPSSNKKSIQDKKIAFITDIVEERQVEFTKPSVASMTIALRKLPEGTSIWSAISQGLTNYNIAYPGTLEEKPLAMMLGTVDFAMSEVGGNPQAMLTRWRTNQPVIIETGFQGRVSFALLYGSHVLIYDYSVLKHTKYMLNPNSIDLNFIGRIQGLKAASKEDYVKFWNETLKTENCVSSELMTIGSPEPDEASIKNVEWKNAEELALLLIWQCRRIYSIIGTEIDSGTAPIFHQWIFTLKTAVLNAYLEEGIATKGQCKFDVEFFLEALGKCKPVDEKSRDILQATNRKFLNWLSQTPALNKAFKK